MAGHSPEPVMRAIRERAGLTTMLPTEDAPEPPRTGARSALAGDREVEEYLHLYLLNRGVLITPFHNMRRSPRP